MKFHKILILSLAAIMPAMYAVDAHQSLLNDLQDAYNSTFSKGNYILQPISVEQNGKWQAFIAKAADYIKTNAPDALDQFNALSQISQNVIAELQKNYEENVRPAFKTDWLKTNGAASFSAFKSQIDLNLLKPLGFNNVVLYFDTLRPRLENILNDLTTKEGKAWLSNYKSTIKFLKKLTKDLQGVLDKAGKDTQTLINELS